MARVAVSLSDRPRTGQIYDIVGSDDVYPSLGRFLQTRLRDPAMQHVNPVLRYSFTPLGFRLTALFSDYIIAVARKA